MTLENIQCIRLNEMQIRIASKSELVSGFNVEYFGVKFEIIFIAEYAV
jgi:NADH:ubiquinone oxidoreductase subunit H